MSKYTRDESIPRIDTLIAMAEVFNVNLHDFILIDLTKEQPKPFDEKDNDASDERIEELNQLLRQRVTTLEQMILSENPDLAKKLGIE